MNGNRIWTVSNRSFHLSSVVLWRQLGTSRHGLWILVFWEYYCFAFGHHRTTCTDPEHSVTTAALHRLNIVVQPCDFRQFNTPIKHRKEFTAVSYCVCVQRPEWLKYETCSYSQLKLQDWAHILFAQLFWFPNLFLHFH